ncbi:OmpA family protein [Curvibacter gracilis]|uniref:OmpA family protein n=1 Tax=Curvibacter gracilis TaxID=230310 RepID=UPI000487C535|nr:OmpA family protein [Curvibacter gracilis]
MSSSQDNDSQQRFALGFLAVLILLVVGSVVGTVVTKFGVRHPAPAAAEAPAAVADAVVEVASVKVENGVVKFFFATNSADVAEGAQQALAEVAQGLAAGRKAAISGFHDATGSVEQNAELAKQRAIAVREVLKALGASEEAIELRKPEVSTGTGTEAEARRVEVILLPAN